jgi:hypothetical protein
MQIGDHPAEPAAMFLSLGCHTKLPSTSRAKEFAAAGMVDRAGNSPDDKSRRA